MLLRIVELLKAYINTKHHPMMFLGLLKSCPTFDLELYCHSCSPTESLELNIDATQMVIYQDNLRWMWGKQTLEKRAACPNHIDGMKKNNGSSSQPSCLYSQMLHLSAGVDLIKSSDLLPFPFISLYQNSDLNLLSRSKKCYAAVRGAWIWIWKINLQRSLPCFFLWNYWNELFDIVCQPM